MIGQKILTKCGFYSRRVGLNSRPAVGQNTRSKAWSKQMVKGLTKAFLERIRV